jgi:hypothetical protein
MLLWPYLMNRDWFPYQDIAIIHSPLLPVLLSLITKIIGIGVIQLKVITWLLFTITGTILYIFSKSKWTLFIWLLLLIRYQGNGLWFESLLTPLILLLYIFIDKKKYLISGILMGLSLLTKQTAVYFFFPIIMQFIFNYNFKNIIRFISGVTSILSLALLIVYLYGILPSYYFWTIKFGVLQMPLMSGHNWATPTQLTIGLFPFSLILIIPFIKKRIKFVEYIIWGIAGIMGAFPRYELFHFQPGLPFVALLIVHGLTQIKQKNILINISAISYIVIIALIIARSAILTWKAPDRFFEPEINQIITYVKLNTLPTDKIFILNTWDHIYAMSDRLPASRPWIPGLYWYMELPQTQVEVVDSLKKTPPKLVIYKDHDMEGLGSYRADLIEDYVFTHYSKYKSFGSGYWILSPNIYLSYD